MTTLSEDVQGILGDAEFVRRIVGGDEAAFGALYDSFAPLVFGQLLQLVDDRQTAEALLVETFYRAWSQAASFDESGAALPRWLLGIARDLASGEESRCAAELSVAAVA